MDIDRLIAAAKEIDRIASLQESRTKELRDLAVEARSVIPNSQEHKSIIQKSKFNGTVINYGDAVNELRAALRSSSKIRKHSA